LIEVVEQLIWSVCILLLVLSCIKRGFGVT